MIDLKKQDIEDCFQMWIRNRWRFCGEYRKGELLRRNSKVFNSFIWSTYRTFVNPVVCESTNFVVYKSSLKAYLPSVSEWLSCLVRDS